MLAVRGGFRRIIGRFSRSLSDKVKASIALDPALLQDEDTEARSKGQGAANQPSMLGLKPRIVVLGSGWAGYNFVNAVDRKRYDVHVVSPSNHFLFTRE